MRAHRFRPLFDRLDARIVLDAGTATIPITTMPAITSLPGSDVDPTAVANSPDPGSTINLSNPTLDPWDYYNTPATTGTTTPTTPPTS